ncbi:hypothetical protein J1N35_007449 [Gossypium stocksii]|uniref:Retrovirus-related Pol polyprotein from transposon TNT 1-94-like beta-barrel domain-containing protein n=1 Tax=Gossypium stocksii TaxID=47602 RepID=A0A9D3W6N4_9ROSI|nr:hypothetical protein J1N35_007449 [Gossypium stocksii]
MVTGQEHVNIILVGLSMENENIRVFASTTLVSLDLLTQILLDCKARQLVLLTEVPMQANLASHQKQDDAIEKNKLRIPEVILKSLRTDTKGIEEVGLVAELVVLVVVGLVFSHSVSYVAKLLTWFKTAIIGATNHITPDMATLTNTSTYTSTSKVFMGNGELVSIANIGSFALLASPRILQLRNVLYVPTVCQNLHY